MSAKSQNERIIFGLKVRQLRQEKGLSFKKLSERSGLSISYLNEIEKGKKYPKLDKVRVLAQVLGEEVDELTSTELRRGLAPVGQLLSSNFLNELPLDLFGIELSKVVQIIASAPLRVGAFISTLVELARNYAMREENFYHGAMRAYQELHYNYFEEIETAAAQFVRQYELPDAEAPSVDQLQAILEDSCQYEIVHNGLKDYPDLLTFRSVFVPRQKRLLLNPQLTNTYKAFQFGKELGFYYLKLKERALSSSLSRVNSFEEVLNHFKAAYFSVAILIGKDHFVRQLRQLFAKSRWNGEAFISLMEHYHASPEMLFLRLTNILPTCFGLRKLFSLRIIHDTASDQFHIDKELHLNHKHYPQSNGISEHYCRRWLSVSLLRDLTDLQQKGKYAGTIVGAQRSRYFGTEDEYLCFTLARPSYPEPGKNVSVALGLLIDENLKKNIAFWDDPAIGRREVNITCERCAIQDCEQRAVPASFIERKMARRKIHESLQQLSEDGK